MIKKKDENIKEKIISEAILAFRRDENNRNWISRLSDGRIVLLHRRDQTIPQPNVKYLCKIQEKEKEANSKKSGYALAWIIGLAEYPRAIIKSDRSCVIVEHPSEKKKPKIYKDIYEAFNTYPNLESLFTIYRTENQKEKVEDPSLLRNFYIEIKIKSKSGSSIKANIKRTRSRSLDLKTIIDEIKRDIK